MPKVNINVVVNYLSGRKDKMPVEIDAPFSMDPNDSFFRSLLDRAQENKGNDEVDDISVTAKVIGL